MTHLVIWILFVLAIIVSALWHAWKVLRDGKRSLAVLYGFYAACFAGGAGAYVWFVY